MYALLMINIIVNFCFIALFFYFYQIVPKRVYLEQSIFTVCVHWSLKTGGREIREKEGHPPVACIYMVVFTVCLHLFSLLIFPGTDI